MRDRERERGGEGKWGEGKDKRSPVGRIFKNILLGLWKILEKGKFQKRHGERKRGEKKKGRKRKSADEKEFSGGKVLTRK